MTLKILRYVSIDEHDARQDKILADYIIQKVNHRILSKPTSYRSLNRFYLIKGQLNETLRNEIYVQIINQTWENDDQYSVSKAWRLMNLCLGSFPPSKPFFKYLLRYSCDLMPSDGFAGLYNRSLKVHH
jgi:hypothetical protein